MRKTIPLKFPCYIATHIKNPQTPVLHVEPNNEIKLYLFNNLLLFKAYTDQLPQAGGYAKFKDAEVLQKMLKPLIDLFPDKKVMAAYATSLSEFIQVPLSQLLEDLNTPPTSEPSPAK